MLNTSILAHLNRYQARAHDMVWLGASPQGERIQSTSYKDWVDVSNKHKFDDSFMTMLHNLWEELTHSCVWDYHVMVVLPNNELETFVVPTWGTQYLLYVLIIFPKALLSNFLSFVIILIQTHILCFLAFVNSTNSSP